MNFDALLEALKTELTQVVREYGEEYINDVVASGTQFALKMRENLIRRSEQLANGQLTHEDFKWLLKSDKELIEMKALEKKGLTVAQLNSLQDAIIGSLIRVITRL